MFVTKTQPRINTPVPNSVVLNAVPSGLEVTLMPTGVPVKELSLTWDFDTTVYTLALNETWGVALGNLCWQPVSQTKRSEWYFVLSDCEKTAAFGVKTGCNSFCQWQIEPDRITLIIDVKNGGEGIELTEPLLCCTVVSAENEGNETVYQTCRRFCRMMCEKPNLPKTPIYGFNTWYYTYGNISRASVMKDAELCGILGSGVIPGAPKPYMVIDDGWTSTRIPDQFNGGPFIPSDDFGDMGVVAEDIMAKGCNPGIWIRALYVRDELCPEIPEYCYSQNQQYVAGKPGKILDPTTEGAKEYIRNLVSGLNAQGYKLIKHDFTCPDYMGNRFLSPDLTVGGWRPYDKTKTNAQILKDLYTLVQESAGDAVVIGCNTYNHLAAGIHQIQRSGCDTSGRRWSTTRAMGVNCLTYRLCQNGTFFETDADCACFTEYVPTDKNILFADAISRCNSALFISAAPDILKAKDIDRLTEIFRRSSMAKNDAEPQDWMANSVPARFTHEGYTVEYDWSDPK